MKILAIETSCDETACAIVENGHKVLANVIASQIDLHAKTGGVVPEVAAREHVLKMIPVLDKCLTDAKCDWSDIDAIAVTKGPGLISSLIIGTETANVISYVKGLPLIAVQHIVGHLYSNWLEAEGSAGLYVAPKFPILVLTVSGGHNEIILMRGHGKFEVIGETLDDAAGEAFDKVARILGLGYPGGPAIAKVATAGRRDAFDFPRIWLKKGSLDFSFSGLKTAVLNVVMKLNGGGSYTSASKLSDPKKAHLAASFQEAVCETLAGKLLLAYEKCRADGLKIKELHLAGGVSANKRLREVIEKKIGAVGGIKFRYPKSISYCTDNAAMIAAAGYFQYKKQLGKYKAATNILPTTSFEIW